MPTVYLRSHSSKVLFDNNKTATGVAVTTGNRDYVLTARKEVILSAGVFHSPHLLMLSGTITTTPFQDLWVYA
jgi:choline dehydrogenase